MTKFFKDLFKINDFNDYNLFENKLNEIGVQFKVSKFNDNVKIIIIDNSEKTKHATGCDYGKGKSKFYFIEEDNTTIELENAYSWNGNGCPWATTNEVKIITSNNPDKYKSLTKFNEYELKLKDFELSLKNILGITTISKSKKYNDKFDFVEKNRKLFLKYLSEFPTGDVNSTEFINSLKKLNKLINKQVINVDSKIIVKDFKQMLDISNIEYILNIENAFENNIVVFNY